MCSNGRVIHKSQFSTVLDKEPSGRSSRPGTRRQPIEPLHEQSLATARTSLVALADGAGSEASSAYEHVLIELDRIHDDVTPDVHLQEVAQDLAQRFAAASAAIEALKEYGVDPLSVELLLWMLEDAYTQDHP